MSAAVGPWGVGWPPFPGWGSPAWSWWWGAALALALAWALLADLRPRPAAPVRPGVLPALLVGVAALALWRPVVALVAALAWPVAVRVLAWRRARADAALTRGRVLEACELLASELGAGRPAPAALELAAGQWAGLEPVLEAQRVGLDVPEALRRLARTPGAEDVRLLAAAWQVAERSGHGLADSVARVVTGLAAHRRSARVVASELASARATARLVAVLPAAALVMGAGTGADPWAFLLGTPAGWVCLGCGLALVAAGLGWIEALADRATR